MGLLSRISAELPVQEISAETKNTGLLAKTSRIVERPVFSSFFDLCNAYSFAHCALLTVVGGVFVITECKGIDAASIASSVSSRDFWNGTIGSSDFFINFTKADNKFSGFYQLFSSRFKDSICGFHFLKISGDCIFVNVDFGSYKDISVSESVLKETILSYLSSRNGVDASLPPEVVFDFTHSAVFLMLLSVKLAINSSVRTVNTCDKFMYDSFFSTIYAEVFSVLRRHFIRPNYCIRSGNGEIKIVLSVRKTLDDSLLQYHISRSLNFILSTYSNSVILLKAGTASSEDDIRRFVLEG